ncbi:MAG: plastocyanin/azurin family copper-binding protein [Thermoproteota archaeon]|nr:plastocyanin/azurin family copper-binding protein [Thermoproteota archaeon]
MSTKKSIAILGIVAVIALGASLGSLPYALVSAQQTNSSSTTSTNSTGGNSVSIVPNASTMTDKAFAPNPLNAKVGDTVTWTNKDTTFHTVTSGTGPSDTTHGKEFDSGLSGPTALTTQGKTFSHKFMTAGEFPYFCQLHPTMVGKVVVK